MQFLKEVVFFFLSILVIIFCRVEMLEAAPAADPTIQASMIPIVQLSDIPWEIFATIPITNVTDNDVDDGCPSLNNGYAFWYRKSKGIYRWRTSMPLSSASKVVDVSSCTDISSCGDKVAFNPLLVVKYWDGTSVGIVATSTAAVISLYNGSVAYSQADGSDFEIKIKKGIVEQQITNDSVWDVAPSLYNGTVAWVHDSLHAPEIWYWDGRNKKQISNSNTTPNMEPSLYDGTIAWSGWDGDAEIFYWNGTTITQITTDNDGTSDGHPSLNDGKIAWERKTANGWEIFYWNGNSVKQITNNTVDDRNPSLFNGAILWRHYDGHDWEIQYAEVDIPKAPTVSTLAASAITLTTANINAAVNPNGQETTYYFEWGTTTSYNHESSHKNAGAGSSSVNVYDGLTGLTSGTTYHFRITASNPTGTVHGSDKSFTTQSVAVSLPVISSGDAENITDNSARLTGTVTPNGTATEYRFEYGSNTTNYGSNTGWISAGNGSGPLNVAVDIGNLNPNTTYHFRLVAQNSAGTVNGNDKTFTTQAVDNPMEDTAHRFTGWWYNKNEPGTGVAIEIKNNHIFLAWFVYDENGKSTWYASGGNLANDTTYTGELRKWTGWPWGESYSTPTSEPVGTVTVVFNKGTQDNIIFTASVGSDVTSGNLNNFMADFAPGDKDSRNLTGWWWDPSYNGMGFFLDARGGKMAMVWYNYRKNKSSRWWTSDGSFADGAITYGDALDGWQNGQCPGCNYKTPSRTPNEGGSINITFTDANHATLITGGTTVHLERFSF